jgi:hypothetical protein
VIIRGVLHCLVSMIEVFEAREISPTILPIFFILPDCLIFFGSVEILLRIFDGIGMHNVFSVSERLRF